jgi:hypothetical protein
MQYIEEAKGSGYDDEHALAHVWNHTTGTHKNAVKEVEKAKTDESHPLHFKNASHEGFVGGHKKAEHKHAYHKELEHAAKAVESIKKHPTFKKSHEAGDKAEVKGKDRGALSHTWHHHGAKNATSKEDISIGKHKISLKKGDSQLMSAEGAETKATYHQATSEAIKHGHMTHKEAEEVHHKIHKVAHHMDAMKHSKSDKETEHHKEEAQKHINEIHHKHKHLLQHVAHEAATGHGKFGGEGAKGTARHLITTTKHGDTHVHDTKTGKDPIEVGIPRVAKPKGHGRPGNLKLDYRVKHA